MPERTCSRPIQTRSKTQTAQTSPQNQTQYEPLVINLDKLIEPKTRTTQIAAQSKPKLTLSN